MISMFKRPCIHFDVAKHDEYQDDCQRLLDWLKANLGQDPPLGSVKLSGFARYGNTLEDHDKTAQAQNSLYIRGVWFEREDYKHFLARIPGLSGLLETAIKKASEEVEDKLKPIWVHALRQGPNLQTATSFGVHTDNDGQDCSQAAWTIIVKLTQDDPQLPASQMHILGLPVISYPSHRGSAVAFPSSLYHSSVKAKQECIKVVIKCARITQKRNRS